MEGAKKVAAAKGPAKALPAAKMPKIETDGEVDLEDHKLDDVLIKEAKDMQSSMKRRTVEGDGRKPSLAKTQSTVTSGEATMSRQARAARWLAKHGMQKMSNILGHTTAPAKKAEAPRPSSKELVVDMDDDDTSQARW